MGSAVRFSVLTYLASSMSNHHRLTTEQFQARIVNLEDTLYQEFVVPNPYAPPPLVTYHEYRQFVDLLIESYFDFVLPSNLVAHPPAVPITPTVPNFPVITPTPGGQAAPPGPQLHPNFERAARCASNTIATGERCCRAAFIPYTLRSVNYRFFKVHKYLPPGGADTTGRPRPLDVWPAPRPPAV